MTTYFFNEEKNGIEVKFDSKPAPETIATLKKHGFRWHGKRKIWYAKQTPETLETAKALAENAEPETAPATDPEPVKNIYGVQVGDIFHASWGYEQTTNDFFQVVALAGKTSVRVRQVDPPIIGSEAVSGMSEDRFYKISRDILPPSPTSIFIKDQEKGDLKRLKSYAADKVSNPQFYLTSYADAYYCEPGTMKAYESWYY